jgi:hypothetical protein
MIWHHCSPRSNSWQHWNLFQMADLGVLSRPKGNLSVKRQWRQVQFKFRCQPKSLARDDKSLRQFKPRERSSVYRRLPLRLQQYQAWALQACGHRRHPKIIYGHVLQVKQNQTRCLRPSQDAIILPLPVMCTTHFQKRQ